MHVFYYEGVLTKMHRKDNSDWLLSFIKIIVLRLSSAEIRA